MYAEFIKPVFFYVSGGYIQKTWNTMIGPWLLLIQLCPSFNSVKHFYIVIAYTCLLRETKLFLVNMNPKVDLLRN